MNDRPRLLWINRYCLLDRSSGASLSVRTMLSQLAERGFDVKVIGTTVFDSLQGRASVEAKLQSRENRGRTVIKVEDGALEHVLVRTASPHANNMSLRELDTLFRLYRSELRTERPDIVWFYGGKSFDLLIPSEAKRFGCATAAYLANGSYKGARWCEDVDLILTDSHATAGLYQERLNISPVPVGKFIPVADYVAARHERKHLSFINPSPAKGGLLVVQLALHLAERRPDIHLEIVESRGTWAKALSSVCRMRKQKVPALPTVTVTPNTADMRPIYGRARAVLFPSLWWESGGRVLAEAMLNAIPAIVTDWAGSPEMIGEGGVKVSLRSILHKSPYKRLLNVGELEMITRIIERIFDDEIYYQKLVQGAQRAGAELHDIEKNTDRLIAHLFGLVPESHSSS